MPWPDKPRSARPAWLLVCPGHPVSHPVSPRCQIDRDAAAEAEAEVAAAAFPNLEGVGGGLFACTMSLPWNRLCVAWQLEVRRSCPLLRGSEPLES
jgi:hypothetical protein